MAPVLLLTTHEGGKDRIVITTNGKYLVASFYQGNHDMNHKLWNIGSTERDIEKCTPCAGAAGMLLHINRKFAMVKLKSSLLWYSFVLNRHSLPISRCRSRYEAELYVLMVSFISSTIDYMRSTKSPLVRRTSYQ